MNQLPLQSCIFRNAQPLVNPLVCRTKLSPEPSCTLSVRFTASLESLSFLSFENHDATYSLVFDIWRKNIADIGFLLWCANKQSNQTERKELTLCPIPCPETFTASISRLEAYPHLVTRGSDVARLLVATKHHRILTISNNVKIT